MSRLSRLLIAGLISFLSAPGAFAETYRVALELLPTRLHPRRNQVNTNNYVLLHLYYPLFSRSPEGKLESEFLDMEKTKALGQSATAFRMCLRPGLKFSDGTEVAVSDLETAIRESHDLQKNLPHLLKVVRTETCLDVQTGKRDARYFQKLVGVGSTVIKGGTESSDFPTGLGPYKVKDRSPGQLTLTENPGRVSGTFNSIEFVRWDPDNPNFEVEDLNSINSRKLPRPDVEYYQSVQTPISKSYALVVNLPWPQRKEFMACLSHDVFREKVRPKLARTPGFLPVGKLGFNVDYAAIRRKHGPCRDNLRMPVDLYVLTPEERSLVNDVIDDIGPNFRKYVTIRWISLKRLEALIFDRTPKVFLSGFDSSGSTVSTARDSLNFFESFVREDRLIQDTPKGLAKLIKSAAQTENEREKEQAYLEAHRLLLESGYVIPIGQVQSSQYYPRDIGNITWGDRLSGFPQIDKMLKIRR